MDQGCLENLLSLMRPQSQPSSKSLSPSGITSEHGSFLSMPTKLLFKHCLPSSLSGLLASLDHDCHSDL